MKAVCPICGKRVEVLKCGRLAAHSVTGVPCHGPYLKDAPIVQRDCQGCDRTEAEHMANNTDYNREYMRETRILRRRLGMCVTCGTRKSAKNRWGKPSPCCKQCLKRNAERTLAAWREKREQ